MKKIIRLNRKFIFLLLLITLIAACNTETDSKNPAAPYSSENYSFSFVLMADPHIYSSSSEIESYLYGAVKWVNDNIDKRNIAWVAVLGDITWSQLDLAHDVKNNILDTLQVPYIPLIGDNEIQSGFEQGFNEVFGPKYDVLSQDFNTTYRNTIPVYNPEVKVNSYFQNFYFENNGLKVVVLDWATRVIDSGWPGEQADLHNFEGGTFQFLEYILKTYINIKTDPLNSVIFLSHHPMVDGIYSPAAFDDKEFKELGNLTLPYKSLLFKDYAGHFHIKVDIETAKDTGYDTSVLQCLRPLYKFETNSYMKIITATFDSATNAFYYESEDLHPDPT